MNSKKVTLNVAITRLGSNDYAAECTGSIVKNGPAKFNESSLVVMCEGIEGSIDTAWRVIPWHELVLGERPEINITYNGFNSPDAQREEAFLKRYFTNQQNAYSNNIGRYV